MGLLREQEKNWSSAIASVQKARTYSQNAPEPAYHLGICYLQQGKIEQAKVAFNQAIKINPKYAEAYYNLGTILFNQGQLNEGLAAFRKSAAANSSYANAYYGAGLVFMQLKQYKEAIQVFQYAHDLYNIQGNLQWVKNSQQLLQQLENRKK